MSERPAKRPKVELSSAEYLQTINPEVLNFDYEKTCLISLSSVNVYCCLVCGKYFQGRSKSSHSYMHSVNFDHHVFMNMDTLKFYVLPEGNEIQSTAKLIDNIRYLVDPRYTKHDLAKQPAAVFDLNNHKYTPGYIGMNANVNAEYANSIIQLLSHITPIRDHFLLADKLESGTTQQEALSEKLGLVLRKLWSSRLFRNHISAHEFVKETALTDTPKKFLVWLLNKLHAHETDNQNNNKKNKDEKNSNEKNKNEKNPNKGRKEANKGKKESKKSVFSRNCQGRIEITTTPLVTSVDSENRVQSIPDISAQKAMVLKYWILTLDLPVVSEGAGEIPQVSLAALLAKYDGSTPTQSSKDDLRYFQLLDTPTYLIMHIDRNLEKQHHGEQFLLLLKHNPTVVTYPLSLDMSPYTKGSNEPVVYELIANVQHKYVSGTEIDSVGKHQWSTSLRQNTEWVSIHDLLVEPCEKELMFLEETYLLVWEKVQGKKE